MESIASESPADNQDEPDDLHPAEENTGSKKRNHSHVSASDSAHDQSGLETTPTEKTKPPGRKKAVKKAKTAKNTTETGFSKRTYKAKQNQSSVFELVDDTLTTKLDKIITNTNSLSKMINKLDAKVNTLTAKVNSIEEQMLTYAPDIDIIAELKGITSTVNQFKEHITPLTSTQLPVIQETTMNDSLNDIPCAQPPPPTQTNSSVDEAPAKQTRAQIQRELSFQQMYNSTRNPSEKTIASNPNDHQPLIKVTINPKSIIPDWEAKIKARKWAYYKYVNNGGRHEVYTGWETQEEPFIHPDYIPVYIKGESDEEYQFRKDELESLRNHKVKGFAVRRDAGKREFETIDNDIHQRVTSAAVDHGVKEQLLNDYIQIIVSEEQTSNAKWEKIRFNLSHTPDRVNRQHKVKVFTEDGRTYCVKEDKHNAGAVGGTAAKPPIPTTARKAQTGPAYTPITHYALGNNPQNYSAQTQFTPIGQNHSFPPPQAHAALPTNYMYHMPNLYIPPPSYSHQGHFLPQTPQWPHRH